jgi:hypothetical protein
LRSFDVLGGLGIAAGDKRARAVARLHLENKRKELRCKQGSY